MKCLITGATGFLGKYLVEDLVDRFDTVYILTRGPSVEKTKKKYRDRESVVIVQGDIENSDLLDDFNIKNDLLDSINVIFHAAALYDLEASFSMCSQVNIIGTQNVIYFANNCKNLKALHYISTIAVAGNFTGTFYENELNIGQTFTNHYAHTKYVAEKYVQQNTLDKSYLVRVFRLGVLVGDSNTGKFDKIDGPYYILNLLKKIKLNKGILKHVKFIFAPFDRESSFPLIPVDIASKIVCDLDISLKLERPYQVYHVVGQEVVKIIDIFDELFNYFGAKINIINVKNFTLNKYLYKALSIPSEINDYMYSKVKYDITNLSADYSTVRNPRFSEYKDIMFSSFFEKDMKGDL